MNANFTDDTPARNALSHPIALSWLLSDALPVPRPDSLRFAFILESSIVRTPQSKRFHRENSENWKRSALAGEEAHAGAGDIELWRGVMGGATSAGGSRKTSLRSLVVLEKVVDGFALGSVYGSDGSEDVFQELEAPVSKKVVIDFATKSKVILAKYESGATLLKTISQKITEEGKSEHDVVARVYLFDGFPNIDVNGGVFPALLTKSVAHMKRNCPFCATNNVICECPDAYKKEFLPPLTLPAARNLASMVASEAGMMSVPVSCLTMVETFVPDVVPFPINIECLNVMKASTARESILEFARGELEAYSVYNSNLLGSLRMISPLVGTEYPALVGRIDDDDLLEMEVLGETPSASRILGESVRLIIEEPLQFFFGMRISAKKFLEVPEHQKAPASEKYISRSDFHDSLACVSRFGPVHSVISPQTSGENVSELFHANTTEEERKPNQEDPIDDALLNVSGCLTMTNQSLAKPQTELCKVDMAAEQLDASSYSIAPQDFIDGLNDAVTDTDLPSAEANPSFENSTDAGFKYKCSYCDKNFNRSGDKNRHHLSMHMDTPRQHVCSVCGATFKQNWHLKSHMQGIHSEEKPFECDICQFPFARKSDLSKHIRVVHEKIKRSAKHAEGHL